MNALRLILCQKQTLTQIINKVNLCHAEFPVDRSLFTSNPSISDVGEKSGPKHTDSLQESLRTYKCV